MVTNLPDSSAVPAILIVSSSDDVGGNNNSPLSVPYIRRSQHEKGHQTIAATLRLVFRQYINFDLPIVTKA